MIRHIEHSDDFHEIAAHEDLAVLNIASKSDDDWVPLTVPDITPKILSLYQSNTSIHTLIDNKLALFFKEYALDTNKEYYKVLYYLSLSLSSLDIVKMYELFLKKC